MDKYSTKTILEDNLDYLNGKVLDLGCGKGKYKNIILTRATKYMGADLYGDENIDIRTNAKKTPFEDSSFDSIVCLQVLEHIDEPHKVINECFRILRKGGYIILTTPWLYPFHGEPDDYYRFSRRALEFLFHNAGFEIIKLESRGGRFRILSAFARKWVKIRLLKKLITGFLDFSDLIFIKNNKKNLDTPSHLVIAKKL